MGNVSTRVGVSTKEREEILKQMKIRAEAMKERRKKKAATSNEEGQQSTTKTPLKRKTA